MATEPDRSKSWWSNHHLPTSNHLLELQKEIKEEEEEIFADINSLIDSRSNLYSTLDDCDDYDQANLVEQNILPNYQKPAVVGTEETTTTTHTEATIIPATTSITTTTTTNNNNINNHCRGYPSRLHEQSFYSDDPDEEEEDEEEDLIPDRYKSRATHKTVTSTRRDFQSNLGANDDDEETSQDMDHFYIDSGPPPEEVDFMHQDPYPNENIVEHRHRDLTQHEIDDSNYPDGNKFSVSNQISQQNLEAFQAVIQHVTSNLPKPCVFFLEGNCRRSDCKYSHDLSNITCKYWIEGFCFKGELCPFLHSYNQPLDPSDPNYLDEEGLKLLAKKELNPTFAIESEADFPSLPLDAPASALNDSTKSSNNTDSFTSTIKDQILSSNPAVVFKTVKKKRKRG